MLEDDKIERSPLYDSGSLSFDSLVVSVQNKSLTLADFRDAFVTDKVIVAHVYGEMARLVMVGLQAGVPI